MQCRFTYPWARLRIIWRVYTLVTVSIIGHRAESPSVYYWNRAEVFYFSRTTSIARHALFHTPNCYANNWATSAGIRIIYAWHSTNWPRNCAPMKVCTRIYTRARTANVAWLLVRRCSSRPPNAFNSRRAGKIIRPFQRTRPGDARESLLEIEPELKFFLLT